MNTVGTNLKYYREKAKITQKEAAEAIGAAPSAIGHWENNKRTPKLYIVEKLAKLYNTTTENITNSTNYLSKLYDTNLKHEDNNYELNEIDNNFRLLNKIILDLYEENLIDKDANLDEMDDIHHQILELGLRDYIKNFLSDK